eukprot:2971499-Lingulodinium_polyedra.AAC.1
MDGMDQAKFKCPRNVVDAKELESLWRPVLRVTGVLVESIGGYFYVVEADCKQIFEHELPVPESCIGRGKGGLRGQSVGCAAALGPPHRQHNQGTQQNQRLA